MFQLLLDSLSYFCLQNFPNGGPFSAMIRNAFSSCRTPQRLHTKHILGSLEHTTCIILSDNTQYDTTIGEKSMAWANWQKQKTVTNSATACMPIPKLQHSNRRNFQLLSSLLGAAFAYNKTTYSTYVFTIVTGSQIVSKTLHFLSGKNRPKCNGKHVNAQC